MSSLLIVGWRIDARAPGTIERAFVESNEHVCTLDLSVRRTRGSVQTCGPEIGRGTIWSQSHEDPVVLFAVGAFARDTKMSPTMFRTLVCAKVRTLSITHRSVAVVFPEPFGNSNQRRWLARAKKELEPALPGGAMFCIEPDIGDTKQLSAAIAPVLGYLV